VESARRRRAESALFVLFASVCFAISGPLARWARPTDPLLIAFGRLALAALILGAIEARALGPALAGLSSRQRLTVLAAGALLAAHFACFQIGLDRTSLPAAVSLVSLEPLSVVLCAWVLLGMRPSRAEQIGVVVATAGAVLVARGAGKGEHRLAGDLLVLVAVGLYGLYLTVARALKDALPARSYAALVYTSAAVMLAFALAVAPRNPAAAAIWPPPDRGLIAIAVIALVPTILGHTAVQTASRTLPPAIVALVSPGETLGGIVLGAAFLHESPAPTEIAGALIILVGSAIAIFAPRSDPPRSAA
jgi:drug/metabolite transporter (DMT)-like permease